MNLLYLEKFNNYYNRRLKYFSDITSYMNNSAEIYYNTSVDFNPGDGVLTTKTANFDININPDYLLVIDEERNIVSRWFVIEMKRERNGQYTMTFKRDVLSDHYDSIRTCPMFVQRGNVFSNNSLIFNHEGMKVNQIKTNETLLKDETDSAWLVGYISKTYNGSDEIIGTTTDKDLIELSSLELTLNDEANPSQGATFSTLKNGAVETVGIVYIYQLGASTPGTFYDVNSIIYNNFNSVRNYLFTNASYLSNSFTNLPRTSGPQDQIIMNAWSNGLREYLSETKLALLNYLDALGHTPIDDTEKQEILALNNKIIKDTPNNKYYRLVVTNSTSVFEIKQVYNEGSSLALYSALDASATNASQELGSDKNSNAVYFIKYERVTTNVNLVEVEAVGAPKFTISNSRNSLIDAPFDMICMPFSETTLSVANAVVVKLGANCYDFQLLPYCPARFAINGLSGLTVGIDYDNIVITNEDETTTVVGQVYYCRTSSDSFEISQSIAVNLSDPIEMKVANDCDMYRLVSPNYNGAFEFSPVKNNGVTKFIVDYTYKPYSPYIKVSPSFGGLYGSDFGDARGLICNGDFSISMISDAWRTYEINNKNYQNIFDTQIKTMDANNALSLGSQIASSGINAISSGIGIGALSGNPLLGLGTGMASGIGGIADITIGQSIYQNNRQLQKDLFQMNLQTIKARPDTLTKVSAYTINNKLYPFVEYYTCTDIEKEAFRNKIKYEGMSIGAIGTIEQYENPENNYNFFKASPIVLEEIAEDYHVADAIAVELEKGVYL